MEAVLLIGIQAAGKSTFYRERFFDSHLRLNLDMLRTRHRLRVLLRACLDTRQPFVLDNTQPTIAERAPYIAAAKAAGFRVAGYFFTPDLGGSLRRNSQRTGRQHIPPVGIAATAKKLQPPSLEEGFDELWGVRLDAADRF